MSRPAMETIKPISDRAGVQPATNDAQEPGRDARSPTAPSRSASAGRSAQPDAGTPIDTPAAEQPDRKRKIFLIVGILLALAGAGYGTYWGMVGRYFVSTDDAYVGADLAQLSARVSGRVDRVLVDANQRVHTGDVLLRLDDADFRLAVDQAKARRATQEASITRIGRQIEAARAAVLQAKAQVSAAQAEVARADADFKRVQSLASNQYSSAAALDTARANRDKAQASLQAAQAGSTAAEANVSVLEAQQVEARRTSDELRVAVAKAQRDLDGTAVVAPIDGILGNKSVQVGDYVTPGKRLAAIVPDDKVYIDANFKETQLAGIRPGAVAHVTIDAAHGISIDGTVASIAPASGSQFSLLPPENATGNFTKIVQRVPVRIMVPRAIVETGSLRPGLSVVATIDIRTGAATPALRVIPRSVPAEPQAHSAGAGQ